MRVSRVETAEIQSSERAAEWRRNLGRHPSAIVRGRVPLRDQFTAKLAAGEGLFVVTLE
jgi:predicted nucleic acid-binding protein